MVFQKEVVCDFYSMMVCLLIREVDKTKTMLTRVIYPLALREKISWKLIKLYPDVHDKNVSLEFNKKIKLDLLKHDVAHQSIILMVFMN